MNPCNTSYRNQFELDMQAYERDRESAASVTEPCTDCGQPATEQCQFCSLEYCDKCQVTHNCVVAQMRQGRI